MRHPEAARTGPLGFSGLEPGSRGSRRSRASASAAASSWRAGATSGSLEKEPSSAPSTGRWGVPWVDGGTQRMTRVVGQGNALYLIETGERIGGADRVLPAAEPAGRPQGRAGVVGAFAGGGVGPGVSSGPGGRGRSRARGRHQVLRAARARMRTATRPAPFIPETPRAAPRQTGVRHSSDTDLGRRRPRGRLHACNTAGSSTGGPGICRRAPIMPVPGRLGENAWGDRWYSTPPSHPSRW